MNPAMSTLKDPTRSLAFLLLDAVLDKHRALEDALDRLPPADPRDRAAAHRLAAAVLRRAGTLDAVLEPHFAKAPPPPVRLVLLIGAAGLLLLDTPPHAAVGTAVDLARAQKLAPFAGMVNAVLRRVAEHGPALLPQLDSPRLDTPAWLWSSWGDDARAAATAHQQEAPIDLTLRPGAMPPPGGVLLPTGSVRFPPGTRITDLAGFAAGDFWVQDAAAALPAALLAARPGERIADLCAAPGGKTAQLAATGADVTAVERDPTRMLRLRENLARLRLTPTLVEADALTWQPAEKFDAVLLDAPCTATGTIRRHPDVPHTKKPKDVATLAATQQALLEAAATMLKPGGRLIYAVCSLQPEEGPAHKAPAGLEPWPFTQAELAALPEARTANGTLRTHPGLWPEPGGADLGGMDGFFAARFRKT
jgi:16S rRNA (cytosine967-C5)-methyltransferase